MMVWERRLQRHLREHILGYAFTAVLLLGAFIRYSSLPQMAAGQIPGVDETFDNFFEITGRQPVRWEDFVQKHRKVFEY